MNRALHIAMRGLVPAAAFLIAAPALAGVDVGLDYAAPMGLPFMDIRTMVANIIRAALGFVGFILVVQIMHGGFKYMVSGGNEDARALAVEGLKNSIIGFFIVMSASSITHFVVNAVVNATGGGIM